MAIKWTTQDKREILVSNMSDRHITNTLKLLIGKYIAYGDSTPKKKVKELLSKDRCLPQKDVSVFDGDDWIKVFIDEHIRRRLELPKLEDGKDDKEEEDFV